jgi:putative endonuclease
MRRVELPRHIATYLLANNNQLCRFWQVLICYNKTMKKSSNWHIYILRCADNTLYTGITTDLARRLKCHLDGKASKYTRARLPVKILWSENDHTESSAKKREHEIKKLSRSDKLKLIKKPTT